MKHWISLPLLMAMTLTQIAEVSAQRSVAGKNEARGSGSRPGSVGSGTLERSGLRIGQQIPALTVFDEHGEEFPLGRLRAKYTVLVFGCLT